MSSRDLFQELATRKAEGRMVEREQTRALKESQWEDARRDTLEKIVDYGRRREVLENVDTSYLTNVKHDVSGQMSA